MANPLRTVIDFFKGDENTVTPKRLVVLPNGTNRIYMGELGGPPAGSYRDAIVNSAVLNNAVAGDLWIRLDATGQLNAKRRIYICTTGGGSPVWEPLIGPHQNTTLLGVTGTQTPDLSQGEAFLINGATGNITVANPTNSNPSDVLGIFVIQDATGGRQITWGSNYATVWQPNPAPSSTSSIFFLRGGGSVWNPIYSNPFGSPIIIPNDTPVNVAAAVTTDQSLMAYTLPAATLNQVGRTLRVSGSGIIVSTVASYAGIITFKVKIGGNDLVTLSTVAVPTLTLANAPWSFDIIAVTQAVGSGTSGKWEAHGWLSIRDAQVAVGKQSIYNDVATTTMPSTGVDTTSALVVQTTVAFGTTASTSNSCTQRSQLLEVLSAP